MDGDNWTNKVKGLNNLMLFCEDWKTREEIQEYFNLTAQESANACKALKTYYSDVETIKGLGHTKKAYGFKTKLLTLKEIKETQTLLKS